MDRIETSNLNRQFLFRHEGVDIRVEMPQRMRVMSEIEQIRRCR